METLPIHLQTVADFLPDTAAATLWTLTGEALRTCGDVPTVADFETLTVPALASLGIRAELCELPEDDSELQRLIRERLRHRVRVPLLQTVLSPQDTETDAENSEEYDTRQATQILGGRILSEVPADCAELRKFGQFLLILRRAETKGKRLGNRDALLLRLAAFAAAYPERLVTSSPQDEFRRRQCAAFFAELGGKQQTRLHRRLRLIVREFDCGNVGQALAILREIVLDNLYLPDTMHYALLETERPLDPIERRELIYLARAGTLFLKILAVRRLYSETEHAEVRDTLHQLHYDPHLWVRDAAK